MIVRFLTCLAGHNYVRNPGDTGEVSDAEAARLIDKGFAESVGPETASLSPARKATKQQGKPRVNKKTNRTSS